jgi:hypothetical protein
VVIKYLVSAGYHEPLSPCVSIVVASNKNGEETAHHANKIFTCLPYHDDPEDD